MGTCSNSNYISNNSYISSSNYSNNSYSNKDCSNSNSKETCVLLWCRMACPWCNRKHSCSSKHPQWDNMQAWTTTSLMPLRYRCLPGVRIMLGIQEEAITRLCRLVTIFAVCLLLQKLPLGVLCQGYQLCQLIGKL